MHSNFLKNNGALRCANAPYDFVHASYMARNVIVNVYTMILMSCAATLLLC
jgi:hypothetical protein